MLPSHRQACEKPATFQRGEFADNLAISDYITIYSLHNGCDRDGEPLVVQFHMKGGFDGIQNECHCYVTVPPHLWDEWQQKYELARRLEGLD